MNWQVQLITHYLGCQQCRWRGVPGCPKDRCDAGRWLHEMTVRAVFR